MKKLVLSTSLILGISACSSGITNINQVNVNDPILIATAYGSMMSEYCIQNFSNTGKEVIFKQQYMKANKAIYNHLSLTVLFLKEGDSLLKFLQLREKAGAYCKAQNIPNNSTAGQCINAFSADPNGEAIVKIFFNKSYCLKELEDINQFRYKINHSFIDLGRNDLVVE